MNLAMDINDFNIHSVLLLDSKKNMIMDGNFVRILYSDSFCSINGVYLLLPLDTRNDCLKHAYETDCAFKKGIGTKKYIVKLKPNDPNTNSVNKMILIEEQLLDFYKEYMRSEKAPCYSLRDQIYNESLKLYRNQNAYRPRNITEHILKISGIWETSTHFGITYTIIEV